MGQRSRSWLSSVEWQEERTPEAHVERDADGSPLVLGQGGLRGHKPSEAPRSPCRERRCSWIWRAEARQGSWGLRNGVRQLLGEHSCLFLKSITWKLLFEISLEGSEQFFMSLNTGDSSGEKHRGLGLAQDSSKHLPRQNLL